MNWWAAFATWWLFVMLFDAPFESDPGDWRTTAYNFGLNAAIGLPAAIAIGKAFG